MTFHKGLRAKVAPMLAAGAMLVQGGVAHAELTDRAADQIVSDVDAYSPQLSKVALQIWDWAELGFHETRSSALLQGELKKAGFEVRAGAANMPTAFVATYKRGKGPVIGLLAEFDALPGLSQAATPTQQARKAGEAGHGCGHNLFGAASVGAAIATARWMKANNIEGEIRLYGTPAEEGGGGKVFFVRDGWFKDVDAVVTWHPGASNSAAQALWLAQVSTRFTFTGQSAHAAGSPHQGRSALDGVEAMNMMVNLMREHVPAATRIHYVIADGGKAPNVVPDLAKSDYVVRNPIDRENQAIFDRVVKAAEGAALGTGTKMRYETTSSFKDVLPNDVIGRVMDRSLRRVGGVKLNAEELAWAEAMQKNLPNASRADLAAFEEIKPYGLGGITSASSDVGDISYVTPTATISVATAVPGTSAHSWQWVASAGSSIGIKGAVVAAKAMAVSAVELMTDPKALADARAELERRRGANYTYTTLIGTMSPPLDYRDSTK